MVPKELRYTDEHEWIRVEGTTGTVGITEHAQDALGEITFVELPKPGDKVKRKDAVVVVESAKAAADVYAPADGTIGDVNAEVEDAPEMINEAPYGDGWLFKIDLDDPGQLDGLMDAKQYEEFLEKEGH